MRQIKTKRDLMADERLNYNEIVDQQSFDTGVKNLENTFEKSFSQIERVVKSALGNVEEQFKNLDTQIKGTTSGSGASKFFQGFATDLNKVTKEQEKLLKTQTDLNRARKETGDSVAALRAQQKALRTELEATDRSTEAGQKRFNALQKELAQTANAVNKVSKETRELARDNDIVVDSYDDLSKQLREARKALRAIPNAIDKQTGAWDQNNKEVAQQIQRIQKLDRELKGLDKTLGQTQRSVGNYTDSIKEALASLKGVGGGGSGPLGAVVGGFGELGNLAGSIVPGLGGVVNALGPVGLIGGAAFGAVAAGIDQANDLAKEILPQLNQVQAVLGDTEDNASQLTAEIRALSSQFDKDFNEVLRATNALTENFGISGSESISLINSALIQGFDIQDDLVEQINEYSVQLKAAGLGAEDLFAIVQQSAEQGLFSDKALDTIKEGGLAIRELTQTTKDALLPLGEFRNEQILTAVEAGDTFGALQLVSKGLTEVELTASQTQTIIADVFKGAGEDAGIDFILSLQNINREFASLDDIINDTTGAFSDYQKTVANGVLVTQEFEKSQVAVAEAFGTAGFGLERTGKQLKTFFNNLFADLILDTRIFFAQVAEGFQAIKELDFAGLATRVSGARAKVFLEIQLQRKKQREEQLEAERQQQAEITSVQIKAARERADKLAKINLQISQERLEQQAIAEEQIAADQDRAITERIEATRKAAALRLQIEKEALDLALQNEKLTAEERELLILQFQTKTLNATIQFRKDLKALQDDSPIAIIQENALTEIAIEEDKLAKVKELLAARTEASKKQSEERLADEQEKEARRKELFNSGLDAANTALTTALEFRKIAIEQSFQSELAALESRLTAELIAAGDNEEAKAALQAQFDAERQQLEQQRLDQEKKVATFEALIGVATGVAKALGSSPFPFNLIAAGIVAAQGAVQIAAINATPVPAFAKGTKDAPGGLAIVGEKGSELITTPSGEKYLSPSEATLTDLPKHSEVLTASQTKDVLDSMGSEDPLKKEESELVALAEALGVGNRKLLDAVDNQRMYSFNMTRNGIEMFLKTKNNKTTYLDHRYR